MVYGALQQKTHFLTFKPGRVFIRFCGAPYAAQELLKMPAPACLSLKDSGNEERISSVCSPGLSGTLSNLVLHKSMEESGTHYCLIHATEEAP